MMNRRPRGFTLVELLVVIAIIGILAGLIIPSYVHMRGQANRDAMKTDLQRISTSLETYNNDFGDYPPTRLTDLSDEIRVNKYNNGIESLTAALMTTKLNGPYLEWDENRFSNIDGDRVSKNVTGWYFGNNELREMTDLWDNPLIYIHRRDYDKPRKIGLYVDRNQQTFQVHPAKNPDTATYVHPMKHQIWSIGPDMKNDNGGNDDVTSW